MKFQIVFLLLCLEEETTIVQENFLFNGLYFVFLLTILSSIEMKFSLFLTYTRNIVAIYPLYFNYLLFFLISQIFNSLQKLKIYPKEKIAIFLHSANFAIGIKKMVQKLFICFTSKINGLYGKLLYMVN